MGFKMNLAFYAGFGEQGLQALRDTTKHIRQHYPTIPLFADCKRSEMGESVAMVRQEIFDDLGFDAVMVTPWFGSDTIRDYLVDPAYGVVVYVHDSNPSAFEVQDLLVVGRAAIEGPFARPEEYFAQPVPLYQHVAHLVAHEWNTNGNVIAEAGLTYPKALRVTRQVVGPDMPILVAGLGPQGGNVEDLKGVFGTNGCRLFVNISRGIIFAQGEGGWLEKIHSAAREYHRLISATRG